jgi:hypothetical protein
MGIIVMAFVNTVSTRYLEGGDQASDGAGD